MMTMARKESNSLTMSRKRISINHVSSLLLLALLCRYVGVNSFVQRIDDGRGCTPYRYGGTTVTTTLHALKITIRIVGRKASERWIEDGVGIYTKRLRNANVDLETFWHKSDQSLLDGVESEQAKGHTVICLDPAGATHSSESFAEKIYQWLELGGSRVSFIIGGADGLPAALRTNTEKDKFISLSAMTLTHQLARLFLVEQIYRASEIRKGSAYHK